jgi:ATP-dependent DNA helicase RecG
LDKFLLQKQGKRWEGVPVPNVSVTDLSEEAFTEFRHRANRSKRLEADTLRELNAVLLDKLHLVEGKYLKRASLLLFHPDPEKFVTGAFIKIGYFKSDTNLIFQDEIHGHLFNQVNKTLDLLLTKYLRATIRYEGVGRIEEYPYPENALREALLNAIAHKDYSSGIPIQIRVYDDKLSIWNSTQLPEEWTIKRLTEVHSSQPYNPSIANCFFRAGFVESWGRGTLEIIRECIEYGIPEPTFTFDSGVWIEFKGKEEKISSEKMSGKMSGKVLVLIRENPFITIPEIASTIDVTERTIERAIRELKYAQMIERIGPDKGGYWRIIEK